MNVTLAIRNPVQYESDPATGFKTKYRVQGLDQSFTHVHLASESVFDMLRDLKALWAQCSDEAPAGLDCPDPELESLFRREFNCGAIPEDWDVAYSGPKILVPVADGLSIGVVAETAEPEAAPEPPEGAPA
jgi:hypothetical protein